MMNTTKTETPALTVLREKASLLRALAPAVGDRVTGLEKQAEDLEEAVEKVVELVAADRAFNVARAHVKEAEQARGNFCPNPLPHNHPAMRELTEAALRRLNAIAAVQE